MKVLKVLYSLHIAVSAVAFSSSSTTTNTSRTKRVSVEMSADGTINNDEPSTGAHPFNALPGDPSLHLVTNIDLGDKKLEIMKGWYITL
jgi:hypothetical protein